MRIFIVVLFFVHIFTTFEIPDAWNLKFLRNLDDFLFPISCCVRISNDDLKFFTQFLLDNHVANGIHWGMPFSSSPEQIQILADAPGMKALVMWAQNGNLSSPTDVEKQNFAILDKADMYWGVHVGEWGAGVYTCQNHTICDRGIYGLYRCCGYWPSAGPTSEKDVSVDRASSILNLANPDQAMHSKDRTRPPTAFDPSPPYFPETRQEAHDQIKSEVQARWANPGKAWGGYISFNGYSHYSQYAARWGFECAGIEVAENIWYIQTKMMFARSGSRANDVPFCVDVSPWFGPGMIRSHNESTFEAGHSHSFLYRVWALSWFSGAAEAFAEADGAYFTSEINTTNSVPYSEQNITLTPVGEMASKMYDVFFNHDRGVSFTPLAIVVDYYLGYGGSTRAPFGQQQWGYFKATPEEFALYEFFETQLLKLENPYKPSTVFPNNQEQIQLRATPFGDITDVHLSDVNATVLGSYPVLALAAQIDFDRFGFLDSLIDAANDDKNNLEKILIPRYMVDDVSTADMAKLNKSGIVEITEPWINPQTNRESFISNTRLAEIRDMYLPLELSSTIPVQYAVNKNSKGWVVYIANNLGILKEPLGPPSVNDYYTAEVTITPKEDKMEANQSLEWLSGKPIDGPPFKLTLLPGEFVFLEIL